MPTSLPRHGKDVVIRRRRRALFQRAGRRLSRLWGPLREQSAATVMALLCGVVLAVAIFQWQHTSALPAVGIFSPLIVLAGLFLRPVAAGFFFAYVSLAAVVALYRAPTTTRVSIIAFFGQLVVMGVMLWISRSRDRLGVTGIRGESMFVDLRDRLRRGGQLPTMPHGWHAEAALQSAYGNSFSGDFLLTNVSPDGKRLEVVVVDVSGKGSGAGTRALLLSGAFSGLLGSVRPEEFLQAANSYLIRQQWSEGFATCVHLSVDLVAGEFGLGNAGHPPAAQYCSGTGRWQMLEEAHGPLLGVIETPDFERYRGQLARGDALLLYTDGVIEARQHGLDDGVDRMLGVAAKTDSFHGLATAICRAARSGDGDDRAVVVIAWE